MQPQRSRTRCRIVGRGAAGALVLALLANTAPLAVAEEPPSPPVVALDQLLKIPDTLVFEPATRGRNTRVQWRERFEKARAELAEARADLAKSQVKMKEMAEGTSAWKMGAPGIGSVDASSRDTPLDYSLSNEMRRNREDVERGERRLSELEIEANLAGVPREWWGDEAEAAAETTGWSQAPE